MSDQAELFETVEGTAAAWCFDCRVKHRPGEHNVVPFERGMNRSDDAGGKWSDEERVRVDRAIEQTARELEVFTADAVWARAPGVRVTKGLAGRLNAARNRGVIEPTGETSVARRGGDHDHGQRLAVWRSLIR